MPRTKYILIALFMVSTTCSTFAQNRQGGYTSILQGIEEAAVSFLSTVPESEKSSVLYSFDVDERTHWNFVPMTGERKGMSLKEMSPQQRLAVHTLLRSTLSAKGYLKASSIQQLERLLGEIENNPTRRDPGFYYLTFFGEPTSASPWGWRFEGHHLSLNFSIIDGTLSVTPAFLGTNPAQVREGVYSGWVVLSEEILLARQLMDSFTDSQRKRVIIGNTAPRDIITGNQRTVSLDAFEGLPFGEMNETQQNLLLLLISAYTHNLKPEVAQAHLQRIQEAGLARLHFSWAGSMVENEGHYYRIHGPNTLIEYDNTQNNANHVHTVWRNLDNDFGRDLLREHYEQHQH